MGEPLRVTIAPEVVEALQDWSKPIRLKIEDGELICRHADAVSAAADRERWPEVLPALPIQNYGGRS